jgi:hypothetical protein
MAPVVRPGATARHMCVFPSLARGDTNHLAHDVPTGHCAASRLGMAFGWSRYPGLQPGLSHVGPLGRKTDTLRVLSLLLAATRQPAKAQGSRGNAERARS